MAVRVAQWATGVVGSSALRAAIEHPDVELVGVKVYDGAKVGRDAGALCGHDPIGVRAVSSIDDLLATRPECVLHTPQALDPARVLHELTELLRHGVDVVTTAASGAMHPPSLDPHTRGALEQACAEGDATLRASGLSPGFADELVPIVMSGVCGAVEHIEVRESANLAHYGSTTTSALLGWGRPPSYELPDAFLARVDSAFVAPLRVLATGLGAELDRVEVEREHALASATYEIRTGVVPEGTIAGWRFRYLGIVDARVLAVIDTSWRTHDELGTAPGWPTGEAWDVTIVAEPEVRVHWEVGPAAGSASRSVDRMTAAASHLVNSVSAVRRAPSGIMTLGDLANAVGRWAIPPRPRPPGERHP